MFTNVRNDMRIACEEIFGPVLAILPYQNEVEALAIANGSSYGLSALVLGWDGELANRLAMCIEASRMLVNILAHEPNVPFGGFKQSGIGRENGKWGLAAYLEPKSLQLHPF